MNIDIKTSDIKPVRNTYSYVAKRLGEDKPGSRYQEATFDIQEVENFHYRPLWNTAVEIFDKNNTCIVFEDWYSFTDPRQYYYGNYTLARAKQQDGAERNFDFVERRKLLSTLDQKLREKLMGVLIPMRHVEWGSNMNNMFITSYGYGAAITNCSMFAAMDHLGVAQYLTRIGLVLGEGQKDVLDSAKTSWLVNSEWQPLRKYVEDTFVVKDWFKLHVLQNLILDGILYPLVYQSFVDLCAERGAGAVAMLTEFMQECYAENAKWVDASIKAAYIESDSNKRLLNDWIAEGTINVKSALMPLAKWMFDDETGGALEEAVKKFYERASKIGFVKQG